MTADVISHSLKTLLNPKSVAVIGVSEYQAKLGGRLYKILLQHRYDGGVYPINPAIIVTSKFSDLGPARPALEREAMAAAAAHGMRQIGPHCLAISNPANKLVLCASPAVDGEAVIAALMPEAKIDGLSLPAQATSKVVLIIGARFDPQFGAEVIVRAGDVLVEQFYAVIVQPAPVDTVPVPAPPSNGSRPHPCWVPSAAVTHLTRFRSSTPSCAWVDRRKPWHKPRLIMISRSKSAL